MYAYCQVAKTKILLFLIQPNQSDNDNTPKVEKILLKSNPDKYVTLSLVFSKTGEVQYYGNNVIYAYAYDVQYTVRSKNTKYKFEDAVIAVSRGDAKGARGIYLDENGYGEYHQTEWIQNTSKELPTRIQSVYCEGYVIIPIENKN